MNLDFQPALVWPEIFVGLLIVALMLFDMFLRPERRGLLLGVSTAGLLVTLLLMLLAGPPSGLGFHGTYIADAFSFVVKLFLLAVLLSVVLVTRPWEGILGPSLGAHLILVLASGLGMLVLASANDLVLLFVALELATIPLMILTALDRRDPVSKEAAIKFVIVGAVASAFSVFGIALIWGFSGGTTNLGELGQVLATRGSFPALTLGVILLFAGLGFKTAIAPFHVWVPDVYEGAPMPITAFLAGGSKAAGFVALLRVAVPLIGADAAHLFDWPLALALLAGFTAVLGNMAAMWQQNLKRLLAHASIGHAGFLLLGLAVIGTGAQSLGLSALGYYLAFYAVAVTLVFFAMAIVAREGGGEMLSDYEGLAHRSPGVAAGLLVGVLSMGGIPPLAGFFGKILILKAVVDSQRLWLAFVAAFAMVLSIVYMLTVVRALYVTPGREDLPVVRMGRWEGVAMIGLAALLIVFGCWPAPVMDALEPAVVDLVAVAQPTVLLAAAP